MSVLSHLREIYEYDILLTIKLSLNKYKKWKTQMKKF